jgi:hypothetical protein
MMVKLFFLLTAATGVGSPFFGGAAAYVAITGTLAGYGM